MQINRAHPWQKFGNTFFSQNGEDLVILNIFHAIGIEKPSFIDLGAHHPTIISNTRLLYDRGSRGINVEANPNLFKEFEKERKEDINLNIGVSAVVTELLLPYYVFDDTSPRNTFSLEEANQFSAESGMPISKILSIETQTLEEIIFNYAKGVFPDFLNIDIEGSDYDVLFNTSFVDAYPLVACVETRLDQIPHMTAMMMSKGFHTYCRMGENLIFVHKSIIF